MQADKVFDIVADSWQGTKLVCASGTSWSNKSVIVSKHPEVRKLSWTDAAETNL